MAQVQDPKVDGPAEEKEMNASEQNGGGSGGVIAPSTFVFGQNMESRVVKRPADEQLDPEKAEKEDAQSADEEEGEFPKAPANVMAQRPIIAPGSAFKADSTMDTDSSTEAEKSTFKLAPATFAKSDDNQTDVTTSPPSNACKGAAMMPAVLATSQEWQPTFAPATKSSSTPFKLKESSLQAATEHVNGKGHSKKDSKDSASKPDGPGSSDTSNGAAQIENTDSNHSVHSSTGEGATAAGDESTSSTRNNYFIKLNPGDSRDVGFGVFGKFSDSQIGSVSFGGGSQNNKNHDKNDATSENYFLQFAASGSASETSFTAATPTEATSSTSVTSSTPATANATPPSTAGGSRVGSTAGGSPPSLLSLSGSGSSFVFGQHMNERVTSANKKEGELETAAEFVFGQNPGERVKSEETVGESPEKPTSGSTTPFTSAADASKTLAENANAYEEAKENSRLKFEEVPKLTGEEEEENVLQTQCKLYIFDVDKRTWQEKGRGCLRLNDKRQSSSESVIQSRLVMRTQGSLRLILNTKLWSTMILEKASSKSLRISALDSDTKTPRVFLITATPKDAEQIFRAIEHRIQELKHEELMQAEARDAESTNTDEDEEDERKVAVAKREEQDEDDSETTTAAAADQCAAVEASSSAAKTEVCEEVAAAAATTTTTTAATLQSSTDGTSTDKDLQETSKDIENTTEKETT